MYKEFPKHLFEKGCKACEYCGAFEGKETKCLRWIRPELVRFEVEMLKKCPMCKKALGVTSHSYQTMNCCATHPHLPRCELKEYIEWESNKCTCESSKE